MSRCWLDLGSNIDRDISLQNALQALAADFGLVRSSHAYESAPVGFADQPRFYNLCAELETNLSPDELRLRLRELEDRLGRVRGANKYGPRTIDIDLVLHETLQDARLPHPQVEQEAFVLVPLAELIPDFIHPLRRVTLGELAAKCSHDLVRVEVVGVPWFPVAG